jgi:hypothetical protein
MQVEFLQNSETGLLSQAAPQHQTAGQQRVRYQQVAELVGNPWLRRRKPRQYSQSYNQWLKAPDTAETENRGERLLAPRIQSPPKVQQGGP